MAGPITPCKLVGVGKIWNATDNVCLSNQAEFAIITNIEDISIPNGDDFADSSIEVNQLYTARVGFRDVNSALMAAMIGGAATTGNIEHVQDEAGTIPATPFQVTLAHIPYKVGGVTYAPIEVVDQNGRTYRQVATSPTVSGEFVDEADLKLTFHADDTLLDIKTSYFWNNTATGVTVKPAPGTLPGAKKMIFAGKLWSTRLGDWQGNMTCYMAKATRSGEISFGAAVKDAGTFGYDLKLTISVADDLQIGFPQE